MYLCVRRPVGWGTGGSNSRLTAFVFHRFCPNGGKRDRVSAAVLKRQGVKAGVPDLHLPVPKGQYASLYIEMKYGDGRLQKEQKEFLKQAADYGNFVAVCYSQEIALKVIEDYVTLKKGETMPIKNNQVLKR